MASEENTTSLTATGEKNVSPLAKAGQPPASPRKARRAARGTSSDQPGYVTARPRPRTNRSLRGTEYTHPWPESSQRRPSHSYPMPIARPLSARQREEVASGDTSPMAFKPRESSELMNWPRTTLLARIVNWNARKPPQRKPHKNIKQCVHSLGVWRVAPSRLNRF